MNILLGLVGKQRSGKDSVGRFLKENHGFHVYAFADYLKHIGHEYFGFTHDELWGQKTEESRRWMQNMGQFLTDQNTNFFVDVVVEKIKKDYQIAEEKEEDFCAVITDVRRDDELSLFDRESAQFLVWDKIMDTGVSLRCAFDRLGVVLIERDKEILLDLEPGMEKSLQHPIESLPDRYDNWDYMMTNNGSFPELESSVDTMLLEIVGAEYDPN